MIQDFQLAPGDVCGDSTGLRVRVEDIDVYDYVHFCVLEGNAQDQDDLAVGQMSHVAFGHRFIRLWNAATNRKAA